MRRNIDLSESGSIPSSLVDMMLARFMDVVVGGLIVSFYWCLVHIKILMDCDCASYWVTMYYHTTVILANESLS